MSDSSTSEDSALAADTAAVCRARELLGSLKEKREFFESRIAQNNNATKETAAVSRAREILGSLKEKREFFESRIARNSATNNVGSPCPASTNVIKPMPIRPPLFTAEEAAIITRQLSFSIQERQSRLTRISGRRTPKKRILIPLSSTPSEHSTATLDTTDLTNSPQSTSGDLMGRFLDSSQAAIHLLPRAPTLDEIQEAFDNRDSGVDDDNDSGSTTSESSIQSTTSSSSLDLVSTPFVEPQEPELSDAEYDIPTSVNLSVFRITPLHKPALPAVVAPQSFDETSKPRRTISPILLSKDDLEIPQQKLAVCSPNDTAALGTEEERSVYIGELYAPKSAPQSSSFRKRIPRHERKENNENMARTRAEKQRRDSRLQKGQTIKGIAVVRDHEERRKQLESILNNLQTGLGHDLRTMSASPITLSDGSVLISDESSFDCSTDSNTSGWVSSSADEGLEQDLTRSDESDVDDGDDLILNIDALLPKQLFFKPTPSPQKKTSSPPRAFKRRQPVPDSLLSDLGGRLDSLDEASVEEDILEPLLFVSRRKADKLCQSNGGLYALALSSKDLTETAPTQEVPHQETSRGFLCLSTDFRCGAHGSLYDIAIRSGCKIGEVIKKKQAPAKAPRRRVKKPFFPCQGGHFYIALESGLARTALRSKQPFTVSTKTSRLGAREDETKILPPALSDKRCGAKGSLYIALRSGLQFVPVASLHYIGERTGFRF